jgi:hypothetical protein
VATNGLLGGIFVNEKIVRRKGRVGGGGVQGAYDEEVGTETWEKAGKSHMASAP